MRRMGLSRLGWIAAILAVGGVVLAGAVPAWAVGFPEKDKPIQILLGYAAGGPTDVANRILADGLAKLGLSVVIVNKPGASQQIAHTLLSQAKPDGYTIGTANFPTAIGNYLDPTRKATYTRQSFVPIALHVLDPAVWAVKANSPFKTLKDLLEYAKANPKKIRISTMGPDSEEANNVRAIQKMTGAQFALVNFSEGGAVAKTAFLGDKIEVLGLNAGDMLSLYKNKEARLLGVMDSQRCVFYPDVKTFEEQGYKQNGASSRGLIAPAGTPKEVVDFLSEAIKKVVATEEHQKRMADMGLALRYMDSAQFGKYWAEMEVALKEAETK